MILLYSSNSQADDVESTVDFEVDLDKEENEIRLEHERLAAIYKDESVLLKKALKKSSDNSPILEEDEEESEENEVKPLPKSFHELEASSDFSIKPVSYIQLIFRSSIEFVCVFFFIYVKVSQSIILS